jgi:hypothetical protein
VQHAKKSHGRHRRRGAALFLRANVGNAAYEGKKREGSGRRNKDGDGNGKGKKERYGHNTNEKVGRKVRGGRNFTSLLLDEYRYKYR